MLSAENKSHSSIWKYIEYEKIKIPMQEIYQNKKNRIAIG